MEPFIKNLIAVNKSAQENINELETVLANIDIEDDKDKANYGNCCIALHGFRMVSDATEAMLVNEGIIKTNSGSFYKNIDEELDEEDEEEDGETDKPEPKTKPNEE